jgi:hypothetical protein
VNSMVREFHSLKSDFVAFGGTRSRGRPGRPGASGTTLPQQTKIKTGGYLCPFSESTGPPVRATSTGNFRSNAAANALAQSATQNQNRRLPVPCSTASTGPPVRATSTAQPYSNAAANDLPGPKKSKPAVTSALFNCQHRCRRFAPLQLSSRSATTLPLMGAAPDAVETVRLRRPRHPVANNTKTCGSARIAGFSFKVEGSLTPQRQAAGPATLR